jgi:peroxiredoxin Q/BCP
MHSPLLQSFSRTRAEWAIVLGIAGVFGMSAAAWAAGPGVGQRAPDFSLPGSDGEVHRLSQVLADDGTSAVVLAFFPKAFTPG